MDQLRTYLNAIEPIPEAAWQEIVPVLSLGKLAKGDFFSEKGEQSIYLGFLLSGSMRAFSRNPEGKDYNKSFFVAPSLFGPLSALVTGQPNQIMIEAMEPCTLVRIPYLELVAQYERHHAFERLARKYAEYLFVQKEIREIDLVTLDAAERYKKFQAQFPGLENRIPQYHIASYLGVTATQLSRIRGKK